MWPPSAHWLTQPNRCWIGSSMRVCVCTMRLRVAWYVCRVVMASGDIMVPCGEHSGRPSQYVFGGQHKKYLNAWRHSTHTHRPRTTKDINGICAMQPIKCHVHNKSIKKKHHRNGPHTPEHAQHTTLCIWPAPEAVLINVFFLNNGQLLDAGN